MPITVNGKLINHPSALCEFRQKRRRKREEKESKPFAWRYFRRRDGRKNGGREPYWNEEKCFYFPCSLSPLAKWMKALINSNARETQETHKRLHQSSEATFVVLSLRNVQLANGNGADLDYRKAWANIRTTRFVQQIKTNEIIMRCSERVWCELNLIIQFVWCFWWARVEQDFSKSSWNHFNVSPMKGLVMLLIQP